MVTTFRFQHAWHLAAPAGRVYTALADVERYAAWWPQVRLTERIDDQSGRTRVRSLLPYTLELVLRREVEDRSSGVLRVALSGDLEGWCQWRVSAAGEGAAVARFDQVAQVIPPLLARTAPVAAPLMWANHAWMMRSGRAGLSAYLTGRQLTGRAPACSPPR